MYLSARTEKMDLSMCYMYERINYPPTLPLFLTFKKKLFWAKFKLKKSVYLQETEKLIIIYYIRFNLTLYFRTLNVIC